MKRRVILLILDSFGIGSSRDAEQFGDQGANTLLHIANACAAGLADIDQQRKGALALPHMTRLGLAKAAALACGQKIPGLDDTCIPHGVYGYAQPLSSGKDTQSGHWEIAGVPVLTDWGYFPHTVPCFPAELTQKLIQQARLSGILGNCHASGTTIIEELGEEHIKTGQPIIYTSADSVFQIAAHETYFGLEKLYKTCQIARKLVDPYHIARVIARPFTGEKGHFIRTSQRRDYVTPPPTQTLLDHTLAEGGHVIAIGKIADIFAHQGISEVVKAPSDDALFTATVNALSTTPSKGLIFTNFVDFDSVYGHRRDIAGYARALEAFDQRLPELFDAMEPEDLLIISADHGCDPSWQGSDHTREVIPVLSFGKRLTAQSIGERQSFADIGQSIASYLNLPALQYGKSFLNG